MRFLTLLMSLTLLAPVSGQTRNPDYVLDTLAIATASAANSQTPPAPVEGGASGASSVERLAVTLVSIAPTGVEYGDSVVYEVLIENTTGHSITLPWSPDPAQFKAADRPTLRGFRSGIMGLEVHGARGQTIAFLSPQPLFGSEDRFRSLQVLAPRETALIRARAVWRGTAPELARLAENGTGLVQVSALVSIDGVAFGSSGSLDIIVSGKRR